MSKLVKFNRDGVSIIDDEVANSLSKKKLSASMVSAIEQCPAQWVTNEFVLRPLMPKDVDNAMTRGSLFHKIMEDFFALEPEKRTKEALNEITNEVLSSDDFSFFLDNDDAIKWLIDAIKGYYAMGAKPENVKVATIDGKLGLERFVIGKVGNTKREILGYIDRIIETSNGDLFIEDWKTGAKAKIWKPHTKSTEGFKEQRQQLIYRLLLEQADLKKENGEPLKPVGARLIYPVAQHIEKVDFKDTKLLDKVVESIEKVDEELDTMIDMNHFEYNTSFLCHWCPLVKVCPQAIRVNSKTSEKAITARNSQPEPEFFEDIIEFNA